MRGYASVFIRGGDHRRRADRVFAQAPTPSVPSTSAPPSSSSIISSTVTNCMMTCNATASALSKQLLGARRVADLADSDAEQCDADD